MTLKKIFLAGHNGMVGSAILKQLKLNESVEIITKKRDDLDLTDSYEVDKFFLKEKFDQVYIAAAKVGGILSNSNFPAEFIYQNLMIQNNLIHSSFKTDVSRLLILGSSCIYPKLSRQPINESELLNGYLEETNEAYAVAKIAGIKMCESYNIQYDTDFRVVMPTNLYGKNDNFHPDNSHFIPGFMQRVHKAKLDSDEEVVIWGTGRPKREFLHVDDMANASVFIMGLSKSLYRQSTTMRSSHINVGWGKDHSIADLSRLICEVVGFTGKLAFDESKPDGMPRKVLDTSVVNDLGWYPKISLEEGLESTYSWYVANMNRLRSY